MPRTVIVYRLSVYFSLCLTVSSLYLPVMKSPHNPRRNRHLSESFSGLASSQRSTVHDSSSWNKRAPVYNRFSNVMTRHAGRHKNDQAFVQKMFKIFDLDKNIIRVTNRLEPDETPSHSASHLDPNCLQNVS